MRKINKKDISKILPARTKHSNKTDAGKVLIIGGGKGLYGAGILSALAATRTGAGYTHLMTDLSKFPWLKFPDFILHPLTLKELKNKNEFVIAIGPGLGTSEARKKILLYLIRNKFPKVAVDADALTLLSKMNVTLPSSWVLTPHEGEMARLLGTTAANVRADRKKALLQTQKKFGCTVLLKGSETLVTDATNKIYKITTGTPALAKAGTGDVLLGMIAALMAQNLSSLDSAITASYLHGFASSLWLKKNDHLGLRPTDLIDLIPKTIINFRKIESSKR